jgi:hypothetical protein
MEFRAVLKLGGKTATGIEVPAKIVDGLGAGKKPAVRVSINGHAYRTTVFPRGGIYMIPVSAENRNAAGIAAGDTVKVDVQLDDKPREVDVPADFAKALKRAADAKRFFEDLSYSHKRAYVMWIDDAKKPETRQARITKAVTMLSEGKKR